MVRFWNEGEDDGDSDVAVADAVVAAVVAFPGVRADEVQVRRTFEECTRDNEQSPSYLKTGR